MTLDQILQICLTAVVGLLAAAIKFGASSLNERLKALEFTVGEYAKKLLTLALNEQHIKEKIEQIEKILAEKAPMAVVDRIDERQEDIAMRLHEAVKVLTRVQHTQDKCKTCNHL